MRGISRRSIAPPFDRFVRGLVRNAPAVPRGISIIHSTDIYNIRRGNGGQVDNEMMTMAIA